MRGRLSTAALTGALVLVMCSPATVARDWDDEGYDDGYGRRDHGRENSDSCGRSRGHGHSHHGHAHGGPHRHARAFMIPAVIYPNSVATYGEYYQGRDWYAPHRHHHAVYLFPVVDGYRSLYRPHVYCDGRLVQAYDTPARRPRIDVRF